MISSAGGACGHERAQPASVPLPLVLGGESCHYPTRPRHVLDGRPEGPWVEETPKTGAAGLDCLGLCGENGPCRWLGWRWAPVLGQFSPAKCCRGINICVPLDLTFGGHESRALAVAVCFHFIFFQLAAAIGLDGGLGGAFCSVNAAQRAANELPVPLPDNLAVRPVDQFDVQMSAWIALLVQATSNSLWAYPRLLWGVVGLVLAVTGTSIWWDVEARHCFAGGIPGMSRQPVEATVGFLMFFSWAVVFFFSVTAFARTLAMSCDDGCTGGRGLRASRRYHGEIARQRVIQWRAGYSPFLCCDCNCGCAAGDVCGPRVSSDPEAQRSCRSDQDQSIAGAAAPYDKQQRIVEEQTPRVSSSSAIGPRMSLWERLVTVVDSEGWRCGRPGPVDRCPPARLATAIAFSIFLALLIGALPLVYLFALLPKVNSWLEGMASGLIGPLSDDSGVYYDDTYGPYVYNRHRSLVTASSMASYGQEMADDDDTGEAIDITAVVQLLLSELFYINAAAAESLVAGGLIAMAVGFGMQVWACVRWGEAVRGMLIRGYCGQSLRAAQRERDTLVTILAGKRPDEEKVFPSHQANAPATAKMYTPPGTRSGPSEEPLSASNDSGVAAGRGPPVPHPPVQGAGNGVTSKTGSQASHASLTSDSDRSGAGAHESKRGADGPRGQDGASTTEHYADHGAVGGGKGHGATAVGDEDSGQENPWAAEAAAAAAAAVNDLEEQDGHDIPLRSGGASPENPTRSRSPRGEPVSAQADGATFIGSSGKPDPVFQSRGTVNSVSTVGQGPGGDVSADPLMRQNSTAFFQDEVFADDSLTAGEMDDPDGCWAVVCLPQGEQVGSRGISSCPNRTALCIRDVCGAMCARCMWGMFCCCCIPCRVMLKPRDDEYVAWEQADEGSRAALRWEIAAMEGRARDIDREREAKEHPQDLSALARDWLGWYGDNDRSESDSRGLQVELCSVHLQEAKPIGGGSQRPAQQPTGPKMSAVPPQAQARPGQASLHQDRSTRVRWASGANSGESAAEDSPAPIPEEAPRTRPRSHNPHEVQTQGTGGGTFQGDAKSQAADVVLFRLPPSWRSDSPLVLLCCCCCVDYISNDCEIMGCNISSRPRRKGRLLALPHTRLAIKADVRAAIHGTSVPPGAAAHNQHGRHDSLKSDPESQFEQHQQPNLLPWEQHVAEDEPLEVRASLDQKWGGGRVVTAKASQSGVVAEEDGSVWIRRVVLPSGVLGDVPLDSYDYHLATSLAASHVAANLLAMLAVMGVVVALVFPFVYVRTYGMALQWIGGIIVVGVTNWVVRKCLFRAWLVMPLRLRNIRFFLLIEGLYSVTAGVLAGLASGAVRMVAVAMWRILQTARLDVPQLPGPLRTADSGFTAYAATMRLRMYQHAHPVDIGGD